MTEGTSQSVDGALPGRLHWEADRRTTAAELDLWADFQSSGRPAEQSAANWESVPATAISVPVAVCPLTSLRADRDESKPQRRQLSRLSHDPSRDD
jgi:hypothetical protein